MMPATAPVTERRRVPRLCVVCGDEPRWVDLDGEPTFVGVECRLKGTYLADKAEAEARFADYREQRAWVVAERGWKGGW